MRTRKAVAAVAVALLMATAAMSGGTMAATPTIDSETSDTSFTSELTDESSLDGFNASETNQSSVTWVGDNGTSPTMEVTLNGSDTVYLSNDSMENVTSGTPDASGSYWNVTFNHSELHDVERGINENVTLDFMAHDGNTSNSTTIQVYLNTTDDFTVENLDDVDADEDTDDAPVTTEDVENTFFDTNIGILGIQSVDFSTLDVEERAVAGQDTDIVLVFSNDSVADDASAAVASDAEDGDALYGLPLLVTGDEEGTSWIRIYNEEVPDDVDEDDDTYGVYHSGGVGGEDGIVINLGEQYEDEEEVDVTGTLNAGRITEIQHWARTTSTGEWFGGLFGMLNGSFLIGLGFVAGAPAARRRSVEEAVEFDEPEGPVTAPSLGSTDQPTAEGEA